MKIYIFFELAIYTKKLNKSLYVQNPSVMNIIIIIPGNIVENFFIICVSTQ